uniref:Uncharacterized protein n=1 Tax=Anguilla anguilla TaxID=7936 RepID=A0A0E9QF26_ANGAN
MFQRRFRNPSGFIVYDYFESELAYSEEGSFSEIGKSSVCSGLKMNVISLLHANRCTCPAKFSRISTP